MERIVAGLGALGSGKEGVCFSCTLQISGERNKKDVRLAKSKSKSGAILEDRPWYKNTAAVLALSIAAIGLVTTASGLWSNLFDPPPVEVNIEIIVDISEQTGRKVGEVTNFSEIQRALGESLNGVSDNDNVALRTVGGGGCGKDGTRLVESFKTGAHSQYPKILAKVSPGGPRPLTVAIIEATGDFNESRRFSGKKNRIVAIITGEDTCIQVTGRPVNAAELIKSRLRATGIPTDIIVVGFRLPEEMGDRLRRIVEEIGGTFRVANSAEQLRNEVRSSISVTGLSLPALNPRTSVTSPPMPDYFSAVPRDYSPSLNAQYPGASKSDATQSVETPVVNANVEAKLRFNATSTTATSSSICAVEVMVALNTVTGYGYEVGVKDAESSIRMTYYDIDAGFVEEIPRAVATLIKEMRAATPECTAFAVFRFIDYGLYAALSEKIHRQVRIRRVDFVTDEEIALSLFVATVPKRDWESAVLINIGSENTKLHYTIDRKFKSAELPLGSETIRMKASDGGAEFSTALRVTMASIVLPALREMALRNPEIMKRKRVYWIGDAAWGAATYMRPDQAARDFVSIDKSDVKRFLGAMNDNTWSNYKPSTKASPKARAEFAKDSAAITEVFSRDLLASGVSIFDTFINEVGVDGPIQITRNPQWLLGYASTQFSVDIWPDDMPKMSTSNE